MKKYKLIPSCVIVLHLLYFLTCTVFANSSWVWISETRPYDILPWVAMATLLIETTSLIIFAKATNGFKAFTFVTIANLLSFAAPYLDKFFLYSELGFSFEKYLEHWPSYTVGLLFCVVTILVEFPIVYFSLRKNTPSRKKLILSMVISNIVTTILVAVAERIFCVGRW